MIPAITYGGPNVPPEEPSPLSFKLTESYVILEFLADLFPNSGLLPPASNPTGRARVRFFMDVVARNVETPTLKLVRGTPGAYEKLIDGLEKIQTMLPDPDAAEGGEYAIGKDFTNADCAIVPLLASFELIAKTGLGKFELGTGKKLEETLAAAKFDRLRRYKTALWERESVKKVLDLVSVPLYLVIW
ncbi:hypothetical protein J3R83DRAFT_10170 [Lanmaoa asiatica]|nr:hypothetical protein J3R83DRAFT_10170 [Lanmaoa asiatica]